MATLDSAGPRRSTRLVAASVLSAAVLLTYLILPDGDNAEPSDGQKITDANEPVRLEVIAVAPADPSPGTVVSVRYLTSSAPEEPTIYVGKRELRVLGRRPRVVLVQLPSDLLPGHLKLRIATASERSKPYDLRVKAINWRKPFRNLIGGLALLVLGIFVLARGARSITGLQSAGTFARLAQRRLAAVSFGSVVGALMQSTTAAAGLLAGLVSSGVLAVTPAAAAFVGAQLGAAAAPLLVAGIIEPRDGLLMIAIGVLWSGLAPDRRAAALGRFVLGAGLLAFGLQLLRPGLEPFVSSPMLLSLVEHSGAPGLLETAGAALLGAGLAAAFQGPAPVLVLALGIAEATEYQDVRTMLALLSGTGLGAALGALLTTPAGPSCRRLAELNLAAAACGSLFAASTLDIWSGIADRLVAGHLHEVRWGKHVLLPDVSWRLAVAFALCQLAVTLVSLSLLPFLHRWLERLRPEQNVPEQEASTGHGSERVSAGLVRVLQIQRRALDPVPELALQGSREAGRLAEHQLSDAHRLLKTLLAEAVLKPVPSERSLELSRVAFACLQLQRSLEAVLRQAEQLTDARIASSLGSQDPPSLGPGDDRVLTEIHALLVAGIETLQADLERQSPPDMEEACAREIRINGIESRARNGLVMSMRRLHDVRNHLAVLELVDAYEAAGNQVFRVAEVLGGPQPYGDAQLAASA